MFINELVWKEIEKLGMITRWQEVRLKTKNLALLYNLPCWSLLVRLVPFLVNRWPCYRVPRHLDFAGLLPRIPAEESRFELPMNCKYLSQHPKRMVYKSGEAKIIF